MIWPTRAARPASPLLLEQHGGRRTTQAAKPSSHPELKSFEKIAADIVLAYRSDDRGALERIQAHFKHRVTFHDVHSGVRSRLQKDPSFTGSISIAEARDVVAGMRGFPSWADFAHIVTRSGAVVCSVFAANHKTPPGPIRLITALEGQGPQIEPCLEIDRSDSGPVRSLGEGSRCLHLAYT